MSRPPTGTVAFLFTDIEGSTKMWERDRAAMSEALARPRTCATPERVTQSTIEIFGAAGGAGSLGGLGGKASALVTLLFLRL